MAFSVDGSSTGTRFNYYPSTGTCITIILSYTVLEDDIKTEKQSSKLVGAETQG